MREPVFTETLQIAIVVRDLEAAMRTYVHEYGIGPWEIYEFNPGNVDRMVKDDEPAEYAMRIAVTMVGSVQWELIEPLDDRSMYAEFLATKGEGLHHVGVGVPELRGGARHRAREGTDSAPGRRVQRRHLLVPLDRRGPPRRDRDLRLARGTEAGAGRRLSGLRPDP